ncbi:DNA-processing protein DprA [Desulfonatronovibrio magnus]|uniref:DNA-processing protein DprA n=1 Tax=Desulfonatronovibrio magnus TaxID=698827 RepID=UPI0005EB3114|nr:DNA-processing protein DprA [Desulfonatronovibrio magnus]
MTAYSRNDQIFACFALQSIKGIGPRTWCKILEHYLSPAHALADKSRWKSLGLIKKNQERGLASSDWETAAQSQLERVLSKNLNLVLWSDPQYPEMLKQIYDPPVALYYKGDISLLQNHGIAVVGSRQSSAYGQEMARNICSELSKAGLTIISGFAYGIDRQAHMASVDSAGGTIAVLGTGIDLIYPAINKDLWVKIEDSGLIISELEPGSKPEARNFPFRNRIISGLALGVLVIQSALKSGSMITAQLALTQNKEVFAVPGAVNMENYDGCNELIRQGAHLVSRGDDILEVLAPVLKSAFSHNKLKPSEKSPGRPQVPPDLPQDESQLLKALSLDKQVHIDELTQKLDWPSHKVSQVLVQLEIKGLIKRLPGMYYCSR